MTAPRTYLGQRIAGIDQQIEKLQRKRDVLAERQRAAHTAELRRKAKPIPQHDPEIDTLLREHGL